MFLKQFVLSFVTKFRMTIRRFIFVILLLNNEALNLKTDLIYICL